MAFLARRLNALTVNRLCISGMIYVNVLNARIQSALIIGLVLIAGINVQK